MTPLLVTIALAVSAQDPAPPAAPPAPAPAAGEAAPADDGSAPPAAPADEPPPSLEAAPADADQPPPGLDENFQAPAVPPVVDTTPPSIEDFAVAAGSPDAPPRVTAVVTDDASGVDQVRVYFRTSTAGPFSYADLAAGDGGLFVGSLGMGIQRTGFFYYVEVKDAAGNAELLGHADRPIFIPAAGPSVGKTYEKPVPPREGPPIATYWVALAYGIGIVSLAGASVAAFDLTRTMLILNANQPWVSSLGIIDDEFKSISAGTRQQFQTAAILDSAAAGILAVIGVAAFSTGTGLLIYNALEE